MDGTRVSTARAMILCALGAVGGLGIAGYGLFTAAGTSTHTVPPENVALVNRRPILRSDFITQTESETGLKFDQTTRADQLKVLREMVREELLVQRALELDFGETDQGARSALVTAVSDQILAEATTGRPTEEQLQAFYQQHPGQWTTVGVMSLRHFLLPREKSRGSSADQAAAAALIAALRAGKPVDALLAGAGWVEPAAQIDEFYFAEKYRLGEALFAQVANLSAGEMSAPLSEADGLHVVAMLKNVKPVPLSYQAARSQVSSDYNDATQARLMVSTEKYLRERSAILIAPDYAADFKP